MTSKAGPKDLVPHLTDSTHFAPKETDGASPDLVNRSLLVVQFVWMRQTQHSKFISPCF